MALTLANANDATRGAADTRFAPTFDGDVERWADWRFGFTAYAHSRKFSDALKAQAHADAPTESEQLYYALALACQGTARLVVQGVTAGDGVAAWNALTAELDDELKRRAGTLVDELLAWNLSEAETAIAGLARFERAKAAAHDAGAKLDDAILRRTLLRGLPGTYEPGHCRPDQHCRNTRRTLLPGVLGVL